MAYFGRKPEKPGSVPGSQSGAKAKRAAATLRGFAARNERARTVGRSERNSRGRRS